MKRLRWLGLLGAFGVLVAACGPGVTSTTVAPTTATTVPVATTAPPGAGAGGELLLLQWQAPSQANAYLSTGTKDLLASSLVIEPLAKYDPAGLLVPALAAEIPTAENGGIPADQLSITWKLKEGVVWSDGTPLTADDVVFSWQYCTADLSGCAADFTMLANVEAVDATTVKLTFNTAQPFPFVPFVGYTYPIIQKAQFADCLGDKAVACSEQNFAPVGTGPYTVTELKPEDTVTYAFNPNYRGVPDGKPFFGTVTIKGGGDAEAAARSVLEIGEADYGWNLQVAPEVLGPMEAAGNGVVKVAFTANVEHLNFNQTDPGTDPRSDYKGGANPHPVFTGNPDLIRALSMAISREELVAVGYGAAGTPTCTIWPVPGQMSTNNDWCLTQDIPGANALLDQIGAVDSDGDGVREWNGTPLAFDFVTSTNAVRQSNQDLIKSYWEQIGVQVEMRNVDAGLFFDGTGASDDNIWKFFTDIEMFTNGSTSPDPQGYMLSWQIDQIPDAANNYAPLGNIPRFASPDYDATWAQLAATALTDPARNDLVIKLNDLLVSSGAIVPLVHRGSVSAFANSIQGVGDLNGWDSEYWNIEEWTRS